MSIVDRFLPKEKEPEYFLLLKIGLSTLFAIIWEVKHEKIVIVGRGQAPIVSDDLTDVTDQAITLAEKHLPPGKLVEKVIFGLPLDYIENDTIKPALLTKLKDLTKTLGLTPLGFIEIPQALSSYLTKKEESPVTALLVGINKKTISISFLRVGKIFETKQTPRSEHVIVDIEITLTSFVDADVLPARILLYDGEESLDEIKEELMKYPWHTKSSSFLHIPKIEILKPDDVVEALIHAASLEITKHFSEETPPEIADAPAPVSPPAPATVSEDAESLGFVMEPEESEERVDISTDEVEYEQQEKKRFSFPAFLVPTLSFGKFTKTKWIAVIVILLFLLLGGGIYAYWNVPKASVKLIVGVQTLGKDLNLTIDPGASSIDTDRLVIPGRIIEKPVSAKKTIQTTGKKNIGSPAKGKMTIFNKTASEKSFTKGTVLLANSLKFTLDSDVKLASASDTGEGLTFGKVDTNASAASIGPEGNLPENTQFTFADFPSSDYSARAASNLSGGTSRQIDAVAAKDHDTLLSAVSKTLESESQSDLRSQLSDGEEFLENSLDLTAVKESFDKDVGDEASEVTLTLEGNLTGIAYLRSDLNSLAEKYITDTIPSGYSFSKDRTKLQARTIEMQKNGTAVVSAYLRASLLPIISLDDIRKQLAGKTVMEAQEFLKGRDHIAGVEIGIDTPFPFGKDSLPGNSSNISLSIASQ